MEEGQTARHAAPAELAAARQFTVPYAVNLTLASTGGLFSPYDLYKVKDANGDVVFKEKGVFFSSRRLLLDAAGTPLLTMKPKRREHETWTVFRGESTNSKDLLFSVRKPKVFQRKDNFDVFLPTNTDEAAPCDFKIISRSKKYCTICIGETDEIIAQMHRKTAFFARDKLEITVNPNEDFAFIVSLIVIMEEIQASRRRSTAAGSSAAAAGAASAAAAAASASAAAGAASAAAASGC